MLDIGRKDQFPSSFGRLPWLIKFPDEKKETCTFINPINGSKEERNIPEMKGKKCFGCFGEWVLLIDKETRECFFLSLVSYSKVHLPPFQESLVYIEKFSLSSSPTSPDCMITYASFEDDFILFCHKHDKEMQAIQFETPSDVVELNKDSVIIDENQENNENQKRNQISRQWTDLPKEMVDTLLFRRLSLVDCLRVSTLCKTWASTSQFVPKENAWPWLMHSPNVFNGTCKFFDPVCGKEYSLEINALFSNQQLAFHSSRDGWVVMSEGDEAIYVLNPLTEEVIELPGLDCCKYHCISFTGMPTSSDFQAFAFYFEYDDEMVKIYSWRPEQKEWTETMPNIDIKFSGTINNPVFFDGEFYCLDRRGQLGVFNPDKMTWRVLSKPEPICSDVPCHAYACCSLVEIQGDLFAVFRADTPLKPIQVYKLDRSKMTWSEVDNLRDNTIFVGFRNSIAVPSPLKSFRNRICLPKFDGRDHRNSVFYSMDDHQYHPRFYGVEEPTTNVWFQPNIRRLKKEMDAQSILQNESSPN
ncbi:hypothetical protein LUZ61_005552 [Rhynchospora tenuis]|uniref:KIB1-4 beta-propeller domain-containing protein n=1 Tax=Rhynchospora tenuis TaxID=198213 RepID=A0AAD6EUN5_9POAL|nr:hypothetical protein LUZ61_005552 [Rhynchospora tenuis]